MTRRAHLLLLLVQLLCLAAAVTAASGSAGFRAELKHPYAGSRISAHEMIRRSARASRERLARLEATLARHLGDPSAADVPVAPLTDQAHTVTVGIGTPPQPQTLIIDTGSNPVWTQCHMFSGSAAARREPPYDPAKSSSFSFLPCSSRLCKEGQPGSHTCSNKTRQCLFDYVYGSAAADGVLASETFTLGARRKVRVPMTFGCGNLTGGSLVGASGIMGLGPGPMSLISQFKVPRFSYCLTPFSDRKTSRLFLGKVANMERSTKEIQTMSILKNPGQSESLFYYIPMVGLSLGRKPLAVPATSMSIKPDGSSGTIVDSGSTIMSLVEPAFSKLKDAVVDIVKLPMANQTFEDYQTCFILERGVEMGAVHIPPLVLHFDGGANMTLPRSNFFQEPRPGLLCLAVVSGGNSMSIIGNVQQQDLYIVFDVLNSKLSFAPARCDGV